MTTFCESVTPRDEPNISRARVLVINDVGEAMASASGLQPSGGKNSGAGVTPVLFALLAVLCGCGDDISRKHQPPVAPVKLRAAADPAEGVTTELDGAAPELGNALLAELTGDDTAARAAYERLLAAPDAPAPFAARAALHLAQMEARTGKSRHALDLVARASTLGAGDVAISEGVAQVRADVVAASGAGDIRGPKLGTPLPNVDPKVADAFAAAERELARVHALRPRQRLEIWAKEDATEDVILRYHSVADHGGLAQIAADYRIGSVYHDLALGLVFEPPPELDPSGGGLRRTLRTRAVAYLKRAVAAYRACLAVPAQPKVERGGLVPTLGTDAELWRLAADTDLRSALDILGEAGERSDAP